MVIRQFNFYVHCAIGNQQYKKSDPKQSKNKKLKLQGVFHALLIGISRYDELESLATPIKDIRAVGELLKKKYQAKITYLENADRRDITVALNKLKKIFKSRMRCLFTTLAMAWLIKKLMKGIGFLKMLRLMIQIIFPTIMCEIK